MKYHSQPQPLTPHPPPTRKDRKKVFQQNVTVAALLLWVVLTLAALVWKCFNPQP